MHQRIDAQCGVGEESPFIDKVLFLLIGIVCFFEDPPNQALECCNAQKTNENHHEYDAGIAG